MPSSVKIEFRSQPSLTAELERIISHAVSISFSGLSDPGVAGARLELATAAAVGVDGAAFADAAN